MTSIAIITNVIPVYRKSFYEKIHKLDNYEFTIYCQTEIKGMNLNLCHDEIPNDIHILNSIGLNNEKLTWQFLPFLKLLKKHDAYIFYGNPKVFSNVIFSLLLLLLGKRLGVWGQAHTAGANKITESVRLIWWRMFKSVFVYTDKEVEYLNERGFGSKPVIGMNNGLDQEKIIEAIEKWPSEKLQVWQEEQGVLDKRIILSCARLVPKNEFKRVVETLPSLVQEFPDIIWCVIGDGDEKDKLVNRANELCISEHIRWIGSIYDEELISPWFISAKLMVHPSAIGLSLLHAFGYGLPVITHDNNDKHMPEFAAMRPGETGDVYKENDNESLLSVIIRVLKDDANLHLMRRKSRHIANTEFNTNVMVSRFTSFLNSITSN